MSITNPRSRRNLLPADQDWICRSSEIYFDTEALTLLLESLDTQRILKPLAGMRIGSDSHYRILIANKDIQALNKLRLYIPHPLKW